jgi:hypothetical protein
MTHYALLRHGFDIHQNPRRLGSVPDEPFWLGLGHGGAPPSWLVGTTLWLISWEGVIKRRNMLYGWYEVAQVGTRAGVAAQHFASGRTGQLFDKPIGPLDSHPWFAKYQETHRAFRDGDPTDITEHIAELISLTQSAGFQAPSDAWDHVMDAPTSF